MCECDDFFRNPRAAGASNHRVLSPPPSRCMEIINSEQWNSVSSQNSQDDKGFMCPAADLKCFQASMQQITTVEHDNEGGWEVGGGEATTSHVILKAQQLPGIDSIPRTGLLYKV